ncbi:hypothetical protein HQ47_01835 [Porphyromonas macacae]|uniref:Lipocalin-like domain-containing protein n=1 Tax=Porphyromonas macacae TaxID=28115 RepID=A0A0A2ECW9_9PORP|nr:hypothetical protein [Porphyromonas macacae]KGN75447.1 hypothetical protein HQ47_01835 [Porphyromonas macacae]SUB88593.1 Uncharacterised protein [Porphyromonas macacae]
MKHIFIITIISLIVISCSKEEIRLNHLQGKWNECYDNSEFCMDGRIEYDFLGENAYVQTSYDILSHKMSVSKGYYALGIFGENVLTLNPQMSDFSGESYTIVKLTSKEMVWQKVGTTYSKGTFGTEHRRFKRIK